MELWPYLNLKRHFPSYSWEGHETRAHLYSLPPPSCRTPSLFLPSVLSTNRLVPHGLAVVRMVLVPLWLPDGTQSLIFFFTSSLFQVLLCRSQYVPFWKPSNPILTVTSSSSSVKLHPQNLQAVLTVCPLYLIWLMVFPKRKIKNSIRFQILRDCNAS